MPPTPNGIEGLAEGDNGALLVATGSRFTRIVDGKVEAYPLPGISPPFSPYHLLRDSDGSLWIVNQVDNFATMTLAPTGTRLWHAQKHDFAPRLGVAWHPRPNLVVRAGAGIFYDLGYSDVADGMDAFPYVQEKLLLSTPSSPLSFPLSPTNAAPPPFCDVLSPSCLVSYLAVVDPHHTLPRTYEWNAAVEQSLGKADVFLRSPTSVPEVES